MYKIKTGAIPFLEDNGFREVWEDCYVLRFPIYFYRKTPLIFCVATLNLNNGKQITIDLEKNGSSYAIWYSNRDQMSSKFLKELTTAIDKKMHKIGARHYAD